MSEVPLYEQPSPGQVLEYVKTFLEMCTMFMRETRQKSTARRRSNVEYAP
jgi:hypothetical protein